MGGGARHFNRYLLPLRLDKPYLREFEFFIGTLQITVKQGVGEAQRGVLDDALQRMPFVVRHEVRGAPASHQQADNLIVGHQGE